MITLFAVAEAGLLAGLIHLVIILIVLAIVYFGAEWVLGKLGAPPIIAKLVLILCALIALYYLIMFLFTLAP